MAGTKLGGKKAAQTNKTKYGRDFYARIGKMGGTVSRGGGFTDPEVAREAGAKGGKISKRGPAKPKEDDWGFLKDVSAEPVLGPTLQRPSLIDRILRRS